MRYGLLLLFGAMTAAVACGGNSPTSPSLTPSTPSPVPPPPTASSPPPVPPATTWSGTVTDTGTRAAIVNYTATLNGSRVSVAAPGYITRDTRATATAVDLIPEAGFDIDFYRQLARNGLEGTLEPLWVLPEAPMFYIETEGENGFSRATAVELERVARTLVPQLSGGRFQLTRWETGPTPRALQSGWIMIERYDADDLRRVCGRALVGAVAGHIWLNGDNPTCVAAIRPTFAHELGHAFGFFHVNRVGSMMFNYVVGVHTSATDTPTDAERRSAAIAYARPRGNRDVDIDP